MSFGKGPMIDHENKKVDSYRILRIPSVQQLNYEQKACNKGQMFNLFLNPKWLYLRIFYP